ncbi:hypothetical protein [Burkholderia oklahomensis]|uniref:hypothetical protein n=1 Tax=Burkholderia oklahomensis TaxID=342113 RepID=UPI000ADD6942|nr:hypothetical protein [Burkholderia oklahomensis]QPS40644.1 hypothetical protein I6G57_20125 [Burkholderia oklahomensis]
MILTELPKLSHHVPCAREYGTGRAEPLTIRIGEVIVKVDGVVDADTLRVVLGSVRS